MNYLLYGNDRAVIKKEIDNIISKNDIPKDSISEYSLEDSDILDIIDDANTIGMFSTKKAIVINECSNLIKDKSNDIKVLEDYLKNSNKDTYLILNVDDDKIDNNYDSIAMIAMLANQFRFLFSVKRLTNKGKSNDEISKQLGVHPYRVKLAIQTNYNYTEDDYLKYLYKLATMDEKIKMGEIDKDIALELFLLDKDK